MSSTHCAGGVAAAHAAYAEAPMTVRPDRSTLGYRALNCALLRAGPPEIVRSPQRPEIELPAAHVVPSNWISPKLMSRRLTRPLATPVPYPNWHFPRSLR